MERDQVAQRVIAENISILGVEEKSIVIKTTIMKLARNCGCNRGV